MNSLTERVPIQSIIQVPTGAPGKSLSNCATSCKRPQNLRRKHSAAQQSPYFFSYEKAERCADSTSAKLPKPRTSTGREVLPEFKDCRVPDKRQDQAGCPILSAISDGNHKAGQKVSQSVFRKRNWRNCNEPVAVDQPVLWDEREDGKRDHTKPCESPGNPQNDRVEDVTFRCVSHSC